MNEKIKIYNFKSMASVQIEVVPLRTLTTNNRPHLVTPHRTNFYHIFLFKDCQPIHWVDFNPIQIKPYSLLFIDKERVHQFDQLLNYEGDIIIFTDDFFCQSENDARFLRGSILFNDIQDNCLLSLDKDSFDKLYKISQEIDKEFKEFEKNSSNIILKNLLHNFLLLAEREKHRKGYSIIEKNDDFEYSILFRDMLEKNYKTKKSVSFYAQQLAVTERRLGQATKNILGKLPKDIINNRITLEAKRLLVHGNNTIKEIAYELGFEEPTNFIKYFRKIVLQTPLEFRENYLKAT